MVISPLSQQHMLHYEINENLQLKSHEKKLTKSRTEIKTRKMLTLKILFINLNINYILHYILIILDPS